MTITFKNARIKKGLRVYAIGDVHGCVDELREMIANIDADRAFFHSGHLKIIFLSDYVDRGPENCDVIEYLISLKTQNEMLCFFVETTIRKSYCFSKSQNVRAKIS